MSFTSAPSSLWPERQSSEPIDEYAVVSYIPDLGLFITGFGRNWSRLLRPISCHDPASPSAC